MNKYTKKKYLLIALLIPLVLLGLAVVGLPFAIWMLATIACILYILIGSYLNYRASRQNISMWVGGLVLYVVASLLIIDFWLEVFAPVSVTSWLGSGENFLLNGTNIYLYYVFVPVLVLVGYILLVVCNKIPSNK